MHTRYPILSHHRRAPYKVNQQLGKEKQVEISAIFPKYDNLCEISETAKF